MDSKLKQEKEGKAEQEVDEKRDADGFFEAHLCDGADAWCIDLYPNKLYYPKEDEEDRGRNSEKSGEKRGKSCGK